MKYAHVEDGNYTLRSLGVPVHVDLKDTPTHFPCFQPDDKEKAKRREPVRKVVLVVVIVDKGLNSYEKEFADKRECSLDSVDTDTSVNCRIVPHQ